MSIWLDCRFFFVVFLEYFQNLSLIWRRHHYRWRAINFDLYSAVMAIDQWGFLTCHTYCDTDQPFYYGHLRGPVTLTPVVERLAVEHNHYPVVAFDGRVSHSSACAFIPVWNRNFTLWYLTVDRNNYNINNKCNDEPNSMLCQRFKIFIVG